MDRESREGETTAVWINDWVKTVMGLPRWLSGKESTCKAGDLGSVPGSGRSPGEGNGNPPTPVFLPGRPHGERSLVGYSPWGHKDSDTTE